MLWSFQQKKPLYRGVFIFSLISTFLLAPTTVVLAEYHHVSGCDVCHDAQAFGGPNLYFIGVEIQTPNSGPKPVIFTATTGPNSYADGDSVYDGVCEVCHTHNNHHNNDGHDNTEHFDGQRCTACHLHANEFAPPLQQGHRKHLEDKSGPQITQCAVCHTAPTDLDQDYTFSNDAPQGIVFTDGNTLEITTVCNNCHGPSGPYPGALGLLDPVVGAKANFKTGIYDSEGELKEGKEYWCATCHDESQVTSSTPDNNVFAPGVVGDNVTYGFYISGHGAGSVSCTECHDPRKPHIDNKNRTYEIDETTGDVVSPWGNSYRLRTSNTVANEQLCVKCHDQGALRNEGGQSSFKGSESSHNVHIWSNTLSNKLADTDYDGVADSRPGCVTCHNVHGSKSNAMTRTGELASTPGTDDRTPGLDHIYMKTAPGPFSTATWRPTLPSTGTFEVFGWWKKNGGLGTGEYTIYHNGGSTTVTHSQHGTGGQWISLGAYDFSAGTSGYVELSARLSTKLLIADKMGFDTTGDGTPDIIIDDTDPGFSSVDEVNGGEWPLNRWSEGRAINYNEGYIAADGLADSTAGYVRFGSATVGGNKSLGANKTCTTCHGAFLYPRTPFMGPKVINRFEEKRWVLNDGAGVADIVVSVTDPDSNMAGGSVTIDTSSLGGSGSVPMVDNADGTYSYQLPIPVGTPDRSYVVPITTIDAAGNVGTNMSSSVFVKSSASTIYLDNSDVIHSYSDNWLRDIASDSAYRGSYIATWNHRHVADESLLTATWKSQIETAGNYKVYAWLQQRTIWNQNAVYTVQHSGGETPVAINQNTGTTGGGWTLIGTFPFDAGSTASITLNGSDYGLHRQLYVDAVKLEPASE